MKNSWWKIAVVIALIAVVVVVVANKNNTPKKSEVAAATSRGPQEVTSTDTSSTVEPKAVTPSKRVEQPDSKTPDAVTAKKSDSGVKSKPFKEAKHSSAKPKAQPVAEKNLPKLLDLGADKCIPCKMMMPVLDELTKEYEGKLKVEFIDVWKNREQAQKYGIQSIPTQIFYDENGKELFRHEGFFPKEDILATFKEHGIKLK